MLQQERELVKIVSNNPAHPAGYYTQFKEQMKPGDVIFSDEPELTVAQIKVKLAELDIEIPKDVTRKADLLALLNG